MIRAGHIMRKIFHDCRTFMSVCFLECTLAMFIGLYKSCCLFRINCNDLVIGIILPKYILQMLYMAKEHSQTIISTTSIS